MDVSEAALDIHYDTEADVLYVSFGPPREALGTEVEAGIILRLHPDTQQVVGITIEAFRERFGGDRIESLFELVGRVPLCPLPQEIREYAYA